jgi:mRNA-degrading endonuclease RelE of RelBE toxin-antitoxin system
MARVLITVAEVDPFRATAERVGLAEDECEALTLFLAQNREAGTVMQGTGGLRKLRWPGKSKGKRGGYRVIYFCFEETIPLYLLAIYPKNQRVDLTPEQKKRLTALARELKDKARSSRKRGHGVLYDEQNRR